MKYQSKQLIERTEQGEELRFVLFWGHTAAPGKVTKACLSQWFPCHFQVDGVEYCCTEQYMMAQKALLFGDQATCERIMASDQAKEIKALGREVKGFEAQKWDENKYQIVLKGNVAKFSQNEPLKTFLLGTGDAVLAEASPYDGIWGIRLPAEDPRAKDVKSWQGENLLGFALMEVRDILRDIDRQNLWNRDNDQSLLQIYDVRTGECELVHFFDDLIEAPNWTPDGRELVYNSHGRIYRFDLQTKQITEVDTGFVDDCNNDHVLSPDGSMIAVSHATREDGKSRIYVVPMSGGVPRLITPLAPSYLHGWSPDGSTLCYCAERSGEYDVYTIPAQGGLETRLTDAPGLDDGCEYDSAGEYIWFNSVRSGLMQAFRMKADGTEQTQMTFDTEWNTWFPHISPDRRLVSMVCYKKGDVAPGEHVPHKHVELRLMNADGTDLRTVVKLFGGQGTINVNSWSPDSTRFAFVSYRIRGQKEE